MIPVFTDMPVTILKISLFSHLHSNDEAGTFGAVFIVFGLVGAGCVGT
jgi:hypothetical protein